MKLWIDCETFSELDLKTVGTYRYAASCEVMLVTWAVDDGPGHCWDLTLVDGGGPTPSTLLEGINNAHEIWAHNSMFDRNCMSSNVIMSPPLTTWRDTMVQALAHGLPGSLDKLCEIYKLGADHAKIKDGRRLIHLFCKPRPKNSKLRRATRLTHPDDWAKFIEYAKSDIESMRALHYKMPKWNYPNNKAELANWHLDQKINDRGFAIDREMAEAVLVAIGKEKKRLAALARKKTNGAIESTTQRDALLDHIMEEYGISLPGLKKDQVIKALLDEDIPPGVKGLLRIRQQASATSTSKYSAFSKRADDDDRARGTIQFCGAARTGRGAGRGIQAHNFSSRAKLHKDDKTNDNLLNLGIELTKLGVEDLVFQDVMKLATCMVRKNIVAPEGKKFCVSDLANIEGRKVAWFANEEWKLEAFREYDLGLGPDLYKLAYAKAFRVPVESVTKDQRAIGKVMELMLGYGGGVGAFVTGADGYGFNLEELADSIWETLPKNVAREAASFLEWVKDQKRPRFGLSDKAFTTVDTLKRLWREAHPATVQLWRDLQLGAESAILYREPQQVGRVEFSMKGSWLRVRLPSGRFICYPYAEYSHTDGLSYYGVDQYTRKWQKIRTYSGKLLENCIAEDTEVLTDKGWVPIQHIEKSHKVWDGLTFVKHDGLSYRGKQLVLSSFCVKMTPDHLVLTTEGWKHGATAERYNRYECGLPHSHRAKPFSEREVVLGIPVCMRNGEDTRVQRYDETKEEGYRSFLRVQAQGDYRTAEHSARHGRAPGVLGMAQYAGSLPVTHPPSVEELWREGYYGVRKVGRILQEFLGRYGRKVSSGGRLGTTGQYQRIHERELLLENAAKERQQPSYKPVPGNALREDNSGPGGEKIRGETLYNTRETETRMDNQKGPETRRVYDIINCGPRNRFVVRGSDSKLLVVHNCCQASARDVLYYSMPRVEAEGYEIVLHVHDELVTETPDNTEYSAKRLSELLAQGEPWTEGLPLEASGFESQRYKK